MQTYERLYVKEVKEKIPIIEKLASMYPSVKKTEDRDATVQVLSMRLAEKITFRKDLREILELVSYLRMEYEQKNEFYHGFFWALERLFFALESQPFSGEVLEIWKEKEEGLLGRYAGR